MKQSSLIKIVIADDHDVYRKGLKSIINTTKGMKVVEEYNSGNALLDSTSFEKNNILILDISMPGLNGIETLKILRNRKINIKIIMLSMYKSLPKIALAFKNGANSYVIKSSNPNEIIKAIIQVHKKDFYKSDY
jgi:DNA-binding NarL/FixJ family response regulator